MDLLNSIRKKARNDCQRIVLPEGDEERTILAADQIIREKLAYVILLGDPKEIAALAEKYGLKEDRLEKIGLEILEKSRKKSGIKTQRR